MPLFSHYNIDLSLSVVTNLPGRCLRDWSLITGRGGGYKTGGGGAREVLPLRKGGAENVLAMLKGGGGGTTSFGVVFTP